MSDNTELIGEFLIESHENLDRVDRDLLALEKDPGFLAFNILESVTHVGSLLSRVRELGATGTEGRG